MTAFSRLKALPIKAAALVLGAAAILFLPAPASYAAPAGRHFRIEASSFQFSPGTIRVNPGDTVTFDLVSLDYVHGLAIDGYDVDISADPGQTASITFKADKPGSFRFRCTVACGNMHPFMVGRFTVGPNWLLLRGAALGLLAILAGILWSRGPGKLPGAGAP